MVLSCALHAKKSPAITDEMGKITPQCIRAPQKY